MKIEGNICSEMRGSIYSGTKGSTYFGERGSITIGTRGSISSAIPFNNFNNLVLIFPNALNTNSPISKNRKLLIFEFGLSEGASNAYMGAHSAKIDFMNSHGEINLGKNWYSPTGFNNGDIYWDGKLSGQNIPQGVYHWMITLENCEFEAESFKYRAAAWQQVNYKRYFFGLIQTQQYRIIEWTADAEMWHEVTVLH